MDDVMRTQQHIFDKEQIRVRSQKERAQTVKRQRPKSKSRLQLLTGLTKSADSVGKCADSVKHDL